METWEDAVPRRVWRKLLHTPKCAVIYSIVYSQQDLDYRKLLKLHLKSPWEAETNQFIDQARKYDLWAVLQSPNSILSFLQGFTHFSNGSLESENQDWSHVIRVTRLNLWLMWDLFIWVNARQEEEHGHKKLIAWWMATTVATGSYY
jgi:hypothetical protein